MRSGHRESHQRRSPLRAPSRAARLRLPKSLPVLAAATLFAAWPSAMFALEGSLSGYLGPATYRITDDIRVPVGQTLTLAPGVVFEFEDGLWEEYEFDVEGTLIAEGTVAAPVIFRAASGVPEFNYIRIATSSTVLRHCVVRDAGSVPLSSQGGLWIEDCSPLIEDCEVVSASWHGVFVTGSSARPVIRRTVSHECGNDGIDADSGAGLYLENCKAFANGTDGICVAGGPNSIVGCLVYGNGEDGIDCHGTTPYDAAIVNCTVGPHPGEGIADAAAYRLYNTLVVGSNPGVAIAEHSLVEDDLAFFGFQNAGAGDFRLTASSRAVNYGTRFGTAGSLLPANDLAGNARVQGIVDAGAFESSQAVDPGTSGAWFSSNLLAPRMGQAVIREDGQGFTAVVGLMGSYTAGQVTARLVNPCGAPFPLTCGGVSARDLAPGTVWDMQIYSPGLETVQEVSLAIPAGTPEDLYRFEITIGGRSYFSHAAVRVYDHYPANWGFIHITDLHVGYDEEEYSAAERLRAFVAEANFLDPEIVVITGDLCENQNLGHDWPQQYLDAIAGLRVPVYEIPGNHDHYDLGQENNPAGWMRYFHEINRFQASRLELGGARFYGLDTQSDYDITEFYRCQGPADAALDWVEADAAALPPSANPRFLLMHGPNFDYFSWNMTNTGRVRDIMGAYGFDLGLAGHTHRFETFLNSGENSFGRNDFSHGDDWGRDVPFPGYPLHTQTSALGKEDHLAARMIDELRAMDPAEAGRVAAKMGFRSAEALIEALERDREKAATGIFGDDIGWRWVQVNGTGVGFFTADTDGDGFRNTEDPWLLGEIRFDVETGPGGSIVSSVENRHFESWYGVRHYIPADPAVAYAASGGTLLRRLPDGTAVVAVAAVGPLATSVVTLSRTTAVEGAAAPAAFRLFPASPNPFNPRSTIAFELSEAGEAKLSIYSAGGRFVATLIEGRTAAGRHQTVWDGRDAAGNRVASGVYFARLEAGGSEARTRLVLLR